MGILEKTFDHSGLGIDIYIVIRWPGKLAGFSTKGNITM